MANTQSDTSKQSNKATSMAELMARAHTAVPSLQKGAQIKGTITKLSPKEITVDINGKTDAVVLEKDKSLLRSLLAMLKVGDTVTVQILNPESDMGNPVVSLRRFLDNAIWGRLADFQKNQEPIDVTVTEVTRGGYLVSGKNGIAGFLPNSHMLSQGEPNAEPLQKAIKVYVLELNRDAHKVIFSQKPVVSKEDFERIAKAISVGQKIDTVVSNITTFGIFVSMHVGKDSIDGLIHLSELSWDENGEDALSKFTVGQKIEASVIKIDPDAKRVDLSIKRLQADPFEKVSKHMSLEQKVKGTVTKVTASAIYVDVEIPVNEEISKVNGMIRKEKVPPNMTFDEGQSIQVTISQIDSKRHRVLLVPVLQAKPIGYR